MARALLEVPGGTGMPKPNEHPERKPGLPVTAEVGGEGGSYADATLQDATFSGPEGNQRVHPANATEADGDLTGIASEGEQVLEDDATVRPATEPPERQMK
jgi:hypothetical protein